MVEVASVIIVITLSLLITRIATIALNTTGLPREIARFQSFSAFLGVGFTTSESEEIVNQPLSRRILMLRMLFGNAGIISLISLLILTVVGSSTSGEFGLRLGLLVLGVVMIWRVSTTQYVNRRITKLIERALQRWTALGIKDHATLLSVPNGYAVSEVRVRADNPLINKQLADLELVSKRTSALGLTHPDGRFTAHPEPDSTLIEDCQLILFGPEAELIKLVNHDNTSH